jgi:hypothetical protein
MMTTKSIMKELLPAYILVYIEPTGFAREILRFSKKFSIFVFMLIWVNLPLSNRRVFNEAKF